MLVEPARHERAAFVEREVGTGVGRVEEFRGRLGFVLGDEGHAGAGRRTAELGWLEIRRFFFV